MFGAVRKRKSNGTLLIFDEEKIKQLEGKTSDKVQEVIGTASSKELINRDKNIDNNNSVSNVSNEDSYSVCGFVKEWSSNAIV